MADYPLVDQYLADVRKQMGRGFHDDLLDELAAHLDESVHTQIERGDTVLDAQFVALSLFGEPRAIAKACDQNTQSWVVFHVHLARITALSGMVGGLGWIVVAVLNLAIYVHPTGAVGDLGDLLAILTLAASMCTAVFLCGSAPARSGRRSNWRATAVWVLAVTAAALVSVDERPLVAFILMMAASWLATDGLRWVGTGTVHYIRLVIRWVLPLGVLPVVIDQLFGPLFTSSGFVPNLIERASVYGSVCVYGIAVVAISGRVRDRVRRRH